MKHGTRKPRYREGTTASIITPPADPEREREHIVEVIVQRLWLALCSDPERERVAFDALGIKPSRYTPYGRLRDKVEAATGGMDVDALRKI